MHADFFPEVCFQCLATRGNRYFDLVYTDVGPTAGWRETIDVLDPWVAPPPFTRLHGFCKEMIQIDWMHTFHLGIAQDIIGSAIKILCKKRGVFSGQTIALRLNQLFLEIKEWARLRGKQIALKRLRKRTLSWGKGCPVFKSKAADSAIFLQYLSHKLQSNPPPLEEPYAGLIGAVWCADALASCVMHAGTFLTIEEKRQVTILGATFLTTYASLAYEAVSRQEYLFKMRPKLHYFQHMIESARPSRRSPGWDHCFVFEDHIKQCIRMLRKVSHRTAERQLLRRNALAVKQHKLKRLLG